MLDGHIEQPLADILYSDLGYRTLQQRPNVKVSSLFTPGEQSFEAGPKRSIHYQADYDELPSFIWYPLNIVERVDLIEGGNTVLWGDVGDSRGIISVTTKRGEDLDNAVQTLSARDVGFASPLGYQTPAEFYAPAYATEKARRSMAPDYRTTLYWNPSVEFDETGRATVEFYTSDAPADYDISIEGVTQNGKIIQLKKFGLTADSR